MKLEGKRVLVFGAGISGIGAADLLCKVGACPVIYDGNDKQDPEAIKARLEQPENVDIILGELSEEARKTLDLVVMSPGVPTDLPIVQTLRTQGLPIWGEVELAYQMGKGKVLAITGTNGKTTTTAMLGKIMSDYLDSVYVVGNIGTPYTSVALDTKEETVTVAEISSFQLETIQDFQPAVSAILNITEDHLNRHHTMEEYIRVKELITGNQTKDQVCVLNYEDEVLRTFGESGQVKAKVVYFSSLRELPQGIFLRGKEIVLRAGEKEFVITTTDRLKILGRHNHENTMAAAAMAYYAGVPVENIKKSVENFVAVEHRIFVGRAAVGDTADQLHGLRHRQSVDQHSLADAGVTGRRVDLRPECVGRAADLPVGSGIVLVAGRAARCGTEYDGALLDEPGDLVQQLRSHGLQFG